MSNKLQNMSTRDLEKLAREIKYDIDHGNLTRREESIARDDYDAVLDELDYRDKEERNQRPRERTYGENRNNTKDVGSYFNKTNETTMTTGSIFGNNGTGGLNKGFVPESRDNHSNRRDEEPRKQKSDNKEHKIFFSPKYPFVTSPNVKEVLEEIIQNDNKTVWHIKKREFVGNDTPVEYNLKYEPKWDFNPLFIGDKDKLAYISDIENPKIPVSVLSAPITEGKELELISNNKIINKFVFNEISLSITNCIQAIDYFIKLKSLEDIESFLSKEDFKTEYLKHIAKIYRSYALNVKDDFIELKLNKKHIYVDIAGLVIPTEGDRFFVNESSNETLYQVIKGISLEYKTHVGIIEGFDFKFHYYVGFNKILLVRA